MTPAQNMHLLGLIAEEIKAEHGLDEDGKPAPARAGSAGKPVGKQLTPEQAAALWREEM